MIRHTPRRARPLGGQAVVEFALVSLTLLLLFGGVLDLGRGVYQQQLVANATREGLRYGTINPRNDTAAYRGGIADAAAARSPSLGLTSANVVVACSPWADVGDGNLAACATAQVRDRLTICVTYRFALAAQQLIGLPPISLQDCARGTLY